MMKMLEMEMEIKMDAPNFYSCLLAPPVRAVDTTFSF